MKWPWQRPAAPSYPWPTFNREETKHMGTNDTVLDRFARSPIGRKLAAQQQAEELAQRRGWIAQRARLRAEFDRRQPDLVAAAAAAETREQVLAAELERAREARSAAALAATASSLQFDASDGRLMRDLRDPQHKVDRHGREVPCDPEEPNALCFLCRIRELKRRLLAQADAARAAVKTPSPSRGSINPVTMRAPERWSTNAEENRRVVIAVVAAVQQLDALELEALEEADLAARLASIAASVPPVEEEVETHSAAVMTPAEARAFAWRLAEQEAQS